MLKYASGDYQSSGSTCLDFCLVSYLTIMYLTIDNYFIWQQW